MTKKVSFSLQADLVANADAGVLVGEFNNWNPEEGILLQKKEDGTMFAEIALAEGKTYEYRYLLSDGRWVNDHSAKKFSDVHGNVVENCLVIVPETTKKMVSAKPKTEKKIKTAAKVVTDDLTKVKGINKKVSALLVKENIKSFSGLGKTSIKKLQVILDEAGSKYSTCDAATWPKQAKLAAAGKWDELSALQAEIKGSK